MKNKIIGLLCLSLLLSSCNKDDNKAKTQTIYAVGHIPGAAGINFNAVYWKNGKEKVLSKEFSGANSIAVHNGTVYITGWQNHQPVFWKNETLYTLPTKNGSGIAEGISIYGNDIYITGIDIGIPTVWKNGQIVFSTAPDKDSTSYSRIQVINGDYYYHTTKTKNGKKSISYWKNNTEYVFQDSLEIEGLAVSNGQILVLASDNTKLYLFTDRAKTLIGSVSESGSHFSFERIVTEGNDTYISCIENNPVTYKTYKLLFWKNGHLNTFTPDPNFGPMQVKVYQDKLLACGAKKSPVRAGYYIGTEWVQLHTGGISLVNDAIAVYE